MMNFFNPPLFDDENKTRSAGLVHTFGLATFIIAILFCLYFAYLGPRSLAYSVVFCGVAISFVALASLVFLFSGYVSISGHILSVGTWLVIISSTIIYGGVQSVAYSNIIIASIIITGMISGARAASVMSGLTFLVGLLLLYLVQNNLLPEPLTLSQDPLAFLLGTVPVLMLIPVYINVYQRGYHLQMVNVSKRLLAESEAAMERDKNSELKAEIEVRRRVEAQLIEAREEAIKATLAKSEFLANMSHEIRTPMNGVIGMTTLLDMTQLTDDQQDYVSTIRQSGESLLTIINEILDFSKIESGNLELELQLFELTHCIEDAMDLFSLAAYDKQLELNYWLDPSIPPMIMGDPTRLRQILVNLVGNAIKFTVEGGVYLRVTLAEKHEGGYEIHFAIEDTGIGIPADKTSKLFKSFSQVDASTTRRFGGTGLGLAISKRLCELMGGTIWAESKESEGTTFHFTLLTQYAPRVNRSDWQTAHPSLRGRKALVVDSSERSRTILEDYLQHWGMHVTTLSALPESLPKQSNRSGVRQEGSEESIYDFLLVDYQMIDMDTLELSRESMGQVWSERLSIILLASILSPTDRANVDMWDISSVVCKPIKPKLLFDSIQQTLGEKYGHRKISDPLSVDRAQVETASAQEMVNVDSDLPLQVLLVEDNLVNQKVALSILGTLGYRADVANNGLEAIHAVKRQEYDLLFMDVHMPEMNGLIATRKIREMGSAVKQPRIIAMTAAVLPDDQRSTADAGMDDFLAKPLRIEELRKVIAASKALIEQET